MSHPDAFALQNSRLNNFLFAEVGTEQNGSALTVLSVLARLGCDPWAEATRWTTLPKRQSIHSLAESITQMPLDAEAVADAQTTATRLIELLPVQVDKSSPGVRALASRVKWAPLTVFYCALAVVLAVNMLLVPKLIGTPPAAPSAPPALVDTPTVPHAP